MRIAEALERKRSRGGRAFVAYVTAGDPSFEGTRRIIKAIQAGGADIIELGVPHSDPVADGPTNLKAAERALRSGTQLSGILDLAARLRREGCEIPLVLFTYFNPLLRMGVEAFADRAKASGIDGVLVVDLPPEEAGDYVCCLRSRGLDTIFLASPTTEADRLGRIAELSSGFVYYVSRTGVTGVSAALSATLGEELARVQARVKLPICVGFGISTPEQVTAVAGLADGVVVGSALVQIIEESRSLEEAEQRLKESVRRLSAPTEGYEGDGGPL